MSFVCAYSLFAPLQKRKEKIQLEEEREEYEREMQRKKAMEEEQRMIAEQEALEKAEKEAQEKAEKEALERAEKEALEKAALEPDPAEEGTEQVLSEIPEPMPALNEGEEEEKNTENGDYTFFFFLSGFSLNMPSYSIA